MGKLNRKGLVRRAHSKIVQAGLGKDRQANLEGSLKRAGLDYWNEVSLKLWDSFEDLRESQLPDANYFFLTTKSKRPYYEGRFQPNDFLVFGPETKGLPESLLAANRDRCICIPMHGTRSLNLATAVGIVLFEAVRQQQG